MHRKLNELKMIQKEAKRMARRGEKGGAKVFAEVTAEIEEIINRSSHLNWRNSLFSGTKCRKGLKWAKIKK